MDNNEYLGIFVEESEEYLLTLSNGLLEMEKGDFTEDVINETFRAAHTLKGMSGSMGFEKTQDLTHKMENILEEVREKEELPDTKTIDFLFKTLDRLESLVEEIKETGQENSSIEDLLDIKTEFESLNEESTSELFEVTQFERTFLEEALEDQFTIYYVKLKLRDNCLLKYVRTNMFLSELGKLGEIIKMDKTEEHIEEDESYNGELGVIFVSKVIRDEIKVIEKRVSEIKSVEVEPLALKGMSLTTVKNSDHKKLSENSTPEVNVSIDNKERKGKKEVQTQAKAVQNQSLRVSLDKIDLLMNLVEELVLERGRLRNIGSRIGDKELIESLDRLDRNSGDLQTGMLELRMVPIGLIFDRFPRMVRNISVELGKKVNFLIEGSETELDRVIVDELGDPLIHLLRNSLDHGIETPEERLSAGKTEEGNVFIRSYHKGNEAIIELEDDGIGIDTDRIRERLVKNGVLNKEESLNLTTNELNRKIFSPGLSTAEEVTDISGRGVGLDVVKTKIEMLGGSVDIESEKGVGTKFTIKIPLTLSIIQALVLRDEKNVFICPLNNVDEILSVTKGVIRELKGQKVIYHKGEVFDVFNYSHLINRELDVEEKACALIINSVDKTYALLVDEIIEQMEVVLKPLDGLLKDLEGVTGATILGDGSVAFIIDANYF